MADDLLESNIVIKTKVAQPNRDGFKTLFDDVDKLSKKLTDLTSKPWMIKLSIDDSALKAYGLTKKVSSGNSGGAGGGSGGGGGILPFATLGGGGGGGSPPPLPPPGSGNLYQTYRRTTATDKATSVLERSRQSIGGQQVTTSITSDETGKTTKIVVEELNLFEKAIQDRLKANAASLKDERREAAKVNSSRTRSDARQARDYSRQVLNAGSLDQLNQAYNSQITIGGFQPRPSTRTFNTKTGEQAEILNAVKVTGNAFTGYTAEILKANQATKRMTIETLDHSRAIRYLGDSYQNAASKVLLWSAATTSVFAAAAAIKFAAVQVAKLEENTVLLARVGGSFAGGSDDFKLRYESARKLTQQIIELTTVYGGDAVEAQKAAAIFARAGRDEKETLEATRVALIATRIAELETEEAAKLLSGAMLQFNLRASQLLPTLDALNTLSNNYRVTTNDLLQAISRTGAVYAEHNGRLTELASVTAVVAQATSRSGSEIGNAIKTISSNLDRVDTQTKLFETLGVSTVNFAGDSKSLGEILFDLRNKFDDLADSEEKHITLQIAGVRQRNILVSAIKQIDDALIAENKALLIGGSATREFYESAGTLVAGLQRLRAVFVQLSSSGGSVFFSSLKGLIGLLDTVARTFNVFNGLPIKIIAAAGGFVLLHKAISLAVTAVRSFTVVSATMTSLQQFQAGISLQQATAMGIYARSVGAATVASRAFIASGGALTIGLTVAAIAAVNLYQAYDVYNESIEDSTIKLQQSVDAEENKRKAFANTSTAILALIQRYDELKKAGKDIQAQEVFDRAKRVGESAGLNVSSGKFTSNDIIEQQSKLQKASVAKEAELLISQQQKNSTDLEKAKREYREAINRRRGQETASIRGGLDYLGGVLFHPLKTFEHGILNPVNITAQAAHQDQVKAEAAIADARERYLEAEKKIKDLKELEVNLNKFDPEVRKAAADSVRQKLRAERIEADDKARRASDEFDPHGSFSRLAEEHKQLTSELVQQREETERIVRIYEQTGAFQDQAQKATENQTKLLEKQRDVEQQIYRAKFNAAQKSAENLFGARSRITEKSGLSALEVERAYSNQSSYTDELAGIALKNQQQQARLAAASKLAGFTSGDNSPEGAGRLRAAQLEQQNAIVNLKTLEEEHVLAILTAEKNIAVERKKSADEAARALGSLSREDKLRVRAVANYFANNPNKKLSIEEQFLIGPQTGRIVGSYFPGRQESLSSAVSHSPYARKLRDSGFAQTEDLLKGQAEVDQYRRNRSDQDLLNSTMSRLEELEKRHSAAGGVPLLNNNQFNGAFGFGIGGGVTGAGNVDSRIPIDLKGDLIDFTPLIASFENAAGALMDQKIESFAGEVRRIVREEQALGKRVLPNTAFPKND